MQHWRENDKTHKIAAYWTPNTATKYSYIPIGMSIDVLIMKLLAHICTLHQFSITLLIQESKLLYHKISIIPSSLPHNQMQKT